MSNIKISIIIPVYNVEKYLRKALDSVVNQTLKDLEILCINDCSPDNSLKILEEYQAKDNRIKIINLDENKGQGYAKNIALDQAQGDFIMFLDPDDWYTLDACETAYNKISNSNNDFVFFEYYKYDESNGLSLLQDKYSKILKQAHNPDNINPKDCDFYFFYNVFTWNKIYRKSFLKRHNIKFSTARFLEDSSFIAMILANATSFSFIEKPLYYHLKKANNEMTIDYTKYWHSVIENHQNNLDYIQSFQNQNLNKNYTIYAINSTLYWFNQFTQINKNIKNSYYREMHAFYKKISEQIDISTIKQHIHFKKFKIITRHQNSLFLSYKLIEKKYLNKLLSLKNNKGYKQLTILGLPIILYKLK